MTSPFLGFVRSLNFLFIHTANFDDKDTKNNFKSKLCFTNKKIIEIFRLGYLVKRLKKYF